MAANEPHTHNQLDPVDEQHVRGMFVTRAGFILAAVGSAIGLGNIWRFPYIMGENGGAAFILIYLVCILLVGAPVLLGEFALGRYGQTSAIGAYRKAAPNSYWWLNGLMGVVAAFMILSFYSAVAGWVLKYFVTGITTGYTEYTGEVSGSLFSDFISSWQQPIIYQGITIFLTAFIIYHGIEKGIEAAAKYLMPLLFILMLLLLIRSLTLDNAYAGLEFMYKPDFDEVKGTSWLEGLGQAFFTLSVGMGVMITYGSYVRKEVHLGKSAFAVAGMDTLVALLAGMIIFPAVFSFGLSPQGGPGLIFITLPEVFAQMPAGRLVGTAFFFLIFIAALTSCISILEAVVTYMVDDMDIRRHVSTGIAAALIFMVGIPACLSVTDNAPLGWLKFPFLGGPVGFFDLMDILSSRFMLPLGGFVMCLFFAIRWGQRNALREVPPPDADPNHWAIKLWYWTLITVAPLGTAAILVYGVLDLLDQNGEAEGETEQAETVVEEAPPAELPGVVPEDE